MFLVDVTVIVKTIVKCIFLVRSVCSLFLSLHVIRCSPVFSRSVDRPRGAYLTHGGGGSFSELLPHLGRSSVLWFELRLGMNFHFFHSGNLWAGKVICFYGRQLWRWCVFVRKAELRRALCESWWRTACYLPMRLIPKCRSNVWEWDRRVNRH